MVATYGKSLAFPKAERSSAKTRATGLALTFGCSTFSTGDSIGS